MLVKGSWLAKYMTCFISQFFHDGREYVAKQIGIPKHIDNVQRIKKMSITLLFIKQHLKKIIKVDCFFSMFLLDHSVPLNFSDPAACLFKKMLPDTAIVKKY